MSEGQGSGFRRRLTSPATPAPSATAIGGDGTGGANDGDVGWFAETFARLTGNIGQAIRGKHDQINLALIGLVSEGHILLEDAPGVGKTSLARAIAESISGSWYRVQFTPDLLPTDVTGVSIWNQAKARLRVQARPGVRQRRDRRRDQPRLPEDAVGAARGDGGAAGHRRRRVPGCPSTVRGDRHPEPDRHGAAPTTCPRPSSTGSCSRCRWATRTSPPRPRSCCPATAGRRRSARPGADARRDRAAWSRSAHRVRLDPQLVQYAVSLVQATRSSSDLRLGASPRGSLGLLRAAQSLAAAEGRGLRRSPTT